MKAMATNQTISWFHKHYREENLELSPDFQRNPVWPKSAKEKLIETIFMGLPMPEIYYVTKMTPKGEYKVIIVDGQQRLRTIIEFIEGELVLRDKDILTNRQRFSELTDEEKKNFWRYPIVCRDLEDSTDKDVRDLFQRTNMNAVPLNKQELRNAQYSGEFIKTVGKISENPFWTSAGIFSASDIRRMLDLEFISILLSTLIGGIYNRKDELDEFYVNYEDEFEDADKYIGKFNDIIALISLIIPNISKTRWNNKADFFTLFLCLHDLFSLHKDRISEPAFLETIQRSLIVFENNVNTSVNSSVSGSAKFYEYRIAAFLASNDKENRIKRRKILSDFLLENLHENLQKQFAGIES